MQLYPVPYSTISLRVDGRGHRGRAQGVIHILHLVDIPASNPFGA